VAGCCFPRARIGAALTADAGDLIDTLAGTLPLRRPADADEIANTIAYLASDDASFITGAIVPADGGRVAV
jgi:NAD(P)-dependent dehydrogenase (short-subunit alcohol dehydrogenase family)